MVHSTGEPRIGVSVSPAWSCHVRDFTTDNWEVGGGGGGGGVRGVGEEGVCLCSAWSCHVRDFTTEDTRLASALFGRVRSETGGQTPLSCQIRDRGSDSAVVSDQRQGVRLRLSCQIRDRVQTPPVVSDQRQGVRLRQSCQIRDKGSESDSASRVRSETGGQTPPVVSDQGHWVRLRQS